MLQLINFSMYAHFIPSRDKTLTKHQTGNDMKNKKQENGQHLSTIFLSVGHISSWKTRRYRVDKFTEA